MKAWRPSIFEAAPLDGRGHRSNETLLRIDERDALLRAAAKHFPGSGREAARQVRIHLERYGNGRWRRDRAEERCPPQHAGTITALLWAILKTRDHTPSEMVIRRALFVNH